jgi:hypothetical protein
MPVVSYTLGPKDPSIQASGQYRGVGEYLFDDGRKRTKHLRAANQSDWDALLVSIIPVVEAEQAAQDAAEAVDPDIDIDASGAATQQEVAVAYLRTAMAERMAFNGAALFTRFNTYRTNQGWTLDQVQQNLQGAGLTDEEWTKMRAAIEYLSVPPRPQVMTDYEPIQDAWEANQ